MQNKKETLKLLKDRASILKYRIRYATSEQNISKTVQRYNETVTTLKELENEQSN